MRRIAFVAGHPVPYHVPLYREVAKLPEFESLVFFQDQSNLNPTYAAEFKTTIKWDLPLLDGYKFRFLRNFGVSGSSGFFSRINPGLFFSILKGSFDIVVVHGYATASDWVAILAAKLSGAKLVLKGEATLRLSDRRKTLKSRIKRFVLKNLFSACDAIMYSCSGNKEFFANYSSATKNFFFLPCAVDNEYFQSQRALHLSKRDEIRNQLQILPTDFAIIMTARLTKRKRPMDLLQAIGKSMRSDLVAVFMGEGPERSELEKYCRLRNIRANFVGFKNQSELAAYYCAADCFALLSDYDPSPKTLNEAMNFALPVLCTDCAGTSKDLVHEGKNGFILGVGEIDALAAKLNFLADNKQIAVSMGKYSLALVANWNAKNGAKAFQAVNEALFRGRSFMNTREIKSSEALH